MKIHDMFHILLLEPCDRTHKDDVSSPLPINVKSKDKYEIKEILDCKSHYDKLQYFVKWIGYPHSENQWLSENDIAGSKNLVDIFHRLFPKKLTESKERKMAKNNY